MADGRVWRSTRRHLRRRAPAALRELSVEQTGSQLAISFVLRDGDTALALCAQDTETRRWRRLLELAPPVDGRHSAALDIADVPLPARRRRGRMVFAIEMKAASPDRRPRRIPLSRAERTAVGPLHRVFFAATGGWGNALPYLTTAGRVAIAFNTRLDRYGALNIRRPVVKHNEIRIRGWLSTHHGDLRTAHVVLTARRSRDQIRQIVPIRFDPDRTERRFGQRWYRFDVRVDCRSFLRPPHLADRIYDVRFRITTAQNPTSFEVPVSPPRLLTRYLTRHGWAGNADRSVVITPYYTKGPKRLAIKVAHFDARVARYLRVMWRLRHLDRILHAGRQTWLIGEQPMRAQDNGFWFFRYLREHHPRLAAYYVISPDAPDLARVLPLGNVVELGSRQHVRLTLRATKILGTHHPDYLYPLWTDRFGRAVRATRVFLQHGVLGTKWKADFYNRSGWGGFDTDLVIVSSEREKEFLVADFGYTSAEVAVTGLPRFDALFDDDIATNPRQLLVIPTWRDWFRLPDQYPGSEYHEKWSGFLHSPQLRELVEKHGLEVVFCLHPNMQEFREFFADAPVRVITQGEVAVQTLLKQSAMLVTDYSSVAFDFAFLDKPVVYFQFDRRRFLGPSGSHLELDEDLPGPTFRAGDEVIAEVARRLSAGFAMEDKYRERTDRFIAHRDRQNCHRVYQAVKRARRRNRIRRRVWGSEWYAVLVQVIRRSRYYIPAMRRMFALLSRLPADKRLVVFESGLGRQYADSPRYIYEEAVRQRPDLKKVWAYNGRLRTTDPNTRVVPRLSMRYFYYLARAKYWVNNQSFPHYLTRRPNGVFVQTWHGTPLKRMLHDLPESHGRDAGYVGRATRGAQQWSVLVSPSDWCSQRVRTAYRYRGPVLEVGYPRNDVLHAPNRDQLAARVRSRLDLPGDKRIVLYAPTFRDVQRRGGGFSFTLPFDLDCLHDALGADTVLLVRMHLLVATAVSIPPRLRDFARDVSRYPGIEELYLASDALVTDYSSVFFDYAQLRRPMIFYAHDLVTYRDELRGFYLDYDNDLPGPIVETEAALIDALRDLDAVGEKYAERVDDFIQRFAPRDDGHAAERVVREIFGASG